MAFDHDFRYDARKVTAMTLRATVQNGMIPLPAETTIPDGTEVVVRTLKAARGKRPSKKAPKTLYERLKSVIGRARSLPSDASTNHDHYLYGVPKRK